MQVQVEEVERTVGSPVAVRDKQPSPDPEVVAKARRRRFTAAYKLRILQAADGCKESPGALGALLRREGLYSSHLTTWRHARDRGELDALAPKKRGRKAATERRDTKEVERLQRRIAVLEGRLSQAQKIIEIQKKVSELLGIPLGTDDGGRS
jgi:transposase-like protein